MTVQIVIIALLVITGLLLLGFGIYLLVAKQKLDATTSATIKSAVCKTDTKVVKKLIGGDNQSCNVTLTYTDKKGNSYTQKATLNMSLKAGDKLAIRYDSNNPNRFYPGDPPIRMIGGVTTGIAAVLLLGALTWGFFLWRSLNRTGEDTYVSPPQEYADDIVDEKIRSRIDPDDFDDIQPKLDETPRRLDTPSVGEKEMYSTVTEQTVPSQSTLFAQNMDTPDSQLSAPQQSLGALVPPPPPNRVG